MGKKSDDYSNEIEYLRDVISSYFPVYKTEVEFDVLNIYVKASSKKEIEDSFENLRKELVPKNYIPRIVEEQGEHIIKVKKQEERNFRSIKVNAIMLLITITTTAIAGAWWWSNYAPAGNGLFTLHNLRNGLLYYTLPVLLILGTHEMGHYFMARYHGIKASLPFFIPMFPPLGTLGAVISIREPIPDKKSLLDLGIAGPIAGFLVTIPVTILGFYFSSTMTATVSPPTEGMRMIWNLPGIMQGLDVIIPWSPGETMHPTLFAGWLGFLVTGLNLLPASQLDGGHVFRALFGDKSKYVSYAAFGFLIIMGIWMYPGWLILGFFILFLAGIKHPPPLNDLTNLDKKRVVVGFVGIALLLGSFHPLPIEDEEFSYEFEVELEDDEYKEVLLGESANYTLTIENQAKNVEIDDGIEYDINYSLSDETWESNLWIKENSNWTRIEEGEDEIILDKGENQTYRLEIIPTEQIENMKNEVRFSAETDVTGDTVKREKNMTVSIDYGFEVEISDEYPIGDQLTGISRIEDGEAEFNFTILNKGQNDTFEINSTEISQEGWIIEFIENDEAHQEQELEYGEEVEVNTKLRRKDSEKDDVDLVTGTIIVRSNETEEEQGIVLIGIKSTA